MRSCPHIVQHTSPFDAPSQSVQMHRFMHTGTSMTHARSHSALLLDASQAIAVGHSRSSCATSIRVNVVCHVRALRRGPLCSQSFRSCVHVSEYGNLLVGDNLYAGLFTPV